MLSSGVQKIKWEDLAVKRLLGSGNYGDVYEGTWRATPVAVKKLKLTPTEFNMALPLLIQESSLISKLRHPNIVLCSTDASLSLVVFDVRSNAAVDYWQSWGCVRMSRT
jgi:serine/threonine protein kinase